MADIETSKSRPPEVMHARPLHRALMIPLIFVAIMWIVFLVEFETGLNFSKYGLRPRSAEGLLGIITMPFLHGGWKHIFNNTIPMLILGWALFRFYPTIAFKTLIWIWLMSGIWLWISGRPNYHIGASGIVYGLAAFLFLSGWLRREKRVAALSLLVAFMYGGMWWGILPVDPTISWEGHLWGAFAGFILAIYYRKQGPQKKIYSWEFEDEEIEVETIKPISQFETDLTVKTEGSENAPEPIPAIPPFKINYVYRPIEKNAKDGEE